MPRDTVAWPSPCSDINICVRVTNKKERVKKTTVKKFGGIVGGTRKLRYKET